MGRKGAMLLYIVSFALVLAFFAFLTITIIQRPLKGETKYIGEHQIAMLKTSMRAEKSLFYADQAAKIAVPTSIIQLAEVGGVYSSLEEPSECSSYYGYSSWQSNTEKGIKVCYPGNIEMDMKRFAESWLSDMFGSYDGQELNDYAVDYYFKIDAGKVEGIASAPLKFRIVTAIDEKTGKVVDVSVPAATYSVTGGGEGAEGDIVPIHLINGENMCFGAEESCMLNKAAAETLPAIYNLFKENGCTFKITSAYRSEEKYRGNWYGIGASNYPDESIRRIYYCGPKGGSFSHCPHQSGLAIDIETADSGCSYEKRIQLMCQAGWVNYHNERWHFEYKTRYWQNAMANGICQWPAVASVSDSRGEFRAGHAAIKNDFATPDVAADIPPSTPIIKLNADDSDRMANVNKYSDLIDRYSQKYEVNLRLVKAMIAWESRGMPDAISYTGCVGLGQFCYQTAKNNEFKDIFTKVTSCDCGPEKTACKDYHACTPENDDRFNPEKSIEATAKYLSESFKDYEGSVYLVAISYNAGPGVANSIEKNLGDMPRTYENIKRLLDATSLDTTKKEEVDTHMRKVAYYYQLFGGQADQQTFSTIVDGKEMTYIIDVIGEYSVYPSFSVETGYDFGEYDVIAGQIKGDAGSSGMNDIVTNCRNKENDESDCVGSAIEEINNREKMKSAGLKMFNGPCDPKENLWSDFVEGFGRCIDSADNECGCAISIRQPEQNKFTESIRIKIEPVADGTVISTESPKLSETFSIKSEGKEIEASDGSTYYIMKTVQGVKFVDQQPQKLCSLPKKQHKICVVSGTKLPFYDNSIKNAYLKNIVYKFAIGFP